MATQKTKETVGFGTPESPIDPKIIDRLKTAAAIVLISVGAILAVRSESPTGEPIPAQPADLDSLIAQCDAVLNLHDSTFINPHTFQLEPPSEQGPNGAKVTVIGEFPNQFGELVEIGCFKRE